MTRYVAFLRGINVSGRRIKGEQLRVPFEEMGLEDVDTYLVSGNVVFTTDEDPDGLRERIEAQLLSGTGWDVPAFLRTADEVRAIASHEPFSAEVLEDSEGQVQVALLHAEPDAEARERAEDLEPGSDHVSLDGRELYWLPDGTMRTATLGMAAIDQAVGPMTMRTQHTLQRLVAKYFSAEPAASPDEQD